MQVLGGVLKRSLITSCTLTPSRVRTGPVSVALLYYHSFEMFQTIMLIENSTLLTLVHNNFYILFSQL